MDSPRRDDFSLFGKFTFNSESFPRTDYVYDPPEPMPIAEETTLDCVCRYATYAFKILLFPIFLVDYGIRRALSALICQYQWMHVNPNYYEIHKDSIDRHLDNKAELHSFTLYPDCKGDPHISAIKIIPNFQKSVEAKERKWIVIALPNALLHQHESAHEMFIYLAKITGLCIAVTNYRGTIKKPYNPPEKFTDLVEDVDTLVKHLLEEGAQPRNIVMQGLSLGGAVAAEVASRYQGEEKMAYLGENTFDSLQDVCLSFATNKLVKENLEKLINKWSLPKESGEEKILSRMYFGMKEIITFIPHMIARTLLFTTFFFEALYLRDSEKAIESLYEIGKTIVYDTLAFAAGVATLAAAIFMDLTPLIRTFNLALVDTLDNTMLYRILRSPLYTSLMRSYLELSGWTSDTTGAWEKLEGVKLVSQVRNDEVIPFKTSLGHQINQKGLKGHSEEVIIHESSEYNHCTSLGDVDRIRYLRFLESALRIELPPALFVPPFKI